MSQSGGYCLVRRCAPKHGGELFVWASRSFRERVCAIEKLEASQADGAFSQFVHPDDLSAIPFALGRLLTYTLPAEGSCTL